MKDLFEREEEILKSAVSYADTICGTDVCSLEEYQKLVKEYGRILRQLKRVTKVTDKTAVELNEDKLELLNKVHIDELTGIYNRRFFDEELEKSYNFCCENETGLGVLMLDVDFFKKYNDTYGHDAGDECLRRIARTIYEESESQDGFAARYGGEEFVIVVRSVTPCSLQMLAEGILDAIRQLGIPHQNNADRNIVTISIGGFCKDASGSMASREYVKCADKALYRSKQTGRDRYTWYEEEE